MVLATGCPCAELAEGTDSRPIGKRGQAVKTDAGRAQSGLPVHWGDIWYVKLPGI